MIERKFICSWTWINLWGSVRRVEGVVPHQRETLRRTHRAAWIAASTGNPLAAAAADGIWWKWICRLLDLIHVNYFPFMLYCLPHDLIYFTYMSKRGNNVKYLWSPDWGITYTFPFNFIPSPIFSSVMVIHTCTYISLCHLASDTRGIGFWQEIHIGDRWVLLVLTGENTEWEKERGGRKKWKDWGRRWRGGRYSISVYGEKGKNTYINGSSEIIIFITVMTGFK